MSNNNYFKKNETYTSAYNKNTVVYYNIKEKSKFRKLIDKFFSKIKNKKI